MKDRKITVLVIDDSAFMRKIISNILSSDDEIEVVGTARDGEDGLQKIAALNPDVITLDVEMPRMDGLTMLSKQMSLKPIRAVMVSSLTQEGSNVTIKALEMGAIDFVAKPSGTISLDIDKVAEDIVAKVKIASKAHIASDIASASEETVEKATAPPKIANLADIVVVVGSSTGGPQALCKVIGAIDRNIKAAFVIVQHMPVFFTKALADRLNKLSSLYIKEAEDGDALIEGTGIVAKGGYHLDFTPDKIVRLSSAPPVKAVRPAIDVTMSTIARLYGSKTIGVILTGMGTDGSYGVKLIKEAGGHIIAEAASSCVVYGMSRSVIEAGYADEIADIENIADKISNSVKRLASVRTTA